jgi:hypothetical protein
VRLLAYLLLMLLVAAVFTIVVHTVNYALEVLDTSTSEMLERAGSELNVTPQRVDFASPLEPLIALMNYTLIAATLAAFIAIFAHSRRRE